MSSYFSRSTFSLFILFIIIIIIFTFFFNYLPLPTNAQSGNESDSIRLPSEENSPVCTGPIPSYCPVNCFRTDPVCGVDGVTYWCGCADAYCSGIEVAKLGFCEIGNGGNGPVSGQALLLVHIVWLIILGFSVVFGLF